MLAENCYTKESFEKELLKKHPEKDYIEKLTVHNYGSHCWVEITPRKNIPYEITEKIAFPNRLTREIIEWFTKIDLILEPKKEIVDEAGKIIQKEFDKFKERYENIIAEFRVAEGKGYEYLKQEKAKIDFIEILGDKILFGYENIQLYYSVKKRKFLDPVICTIVIFDELNRNKEMVHAVENVCKVLDFYSFSNGFEIIREIYNLSNPFSIMMSLTLLNCKFLYQIRPGTWKEDIQNIFASLRISPGDLIDAVGFDFLD